MARKTERIGLRLTEEQRAAIEEEAARLGVSASSALCAIIDKWMERSREGLAA